jgi:lipoyl(octanoyl) transferase
MQKNIFINILSKMKNIVFEDLELKNYKKVWDYQIELFEKLLTNKNTGIKNDQHYLIFCEHPHVFTIGKNGDQSNLLINNKILEEKGIEYYHIDRGGDITYHGPGQQVVYPIFDLDEFKINTREYVRRLEEAVIETLKHFSIIADRLEGAAGIWIDSNVKGKSRKICAIGIKSSKRVTMHGIALNINTDLSFFSLMNPCGFVDKGVTSIQKELGEKVNFEKVKEILHECILKQFIKPE